MLNSQRWHFEYYPINLKQVKQIITLSVIIYYSNLLETGNAVKKKNDQIWKQNLFQKHSIYGGMDY